VRANRVSRHGQWLATLAIVTVASVLRAQSPETITAVATVKTGTKTSSAPVTVVIEKFAPETERTELMAALKKGGTAAAKTVLAARSSAGSIQVGTHRTPIKYAFARSMGAGRLITVVTAEPIALAGTGLPDSKPKAGFDLGLALLEVPGSGTGQGELAPAAKVRLNDQGAIVTEDANASTVIRLSDIRRK
jgi:hypothetical protein